ncbi:MULTISPECIES: beta-ketoacyl synthase chain length factor [Eikenella]|uniref:Beta-ketoacyl synthase N-terminal domain-containing protein n=1 Tax=Eikenella longinqua TaxID=1795827 RepID=A0A1A9RYE2_9NEIS|nr:MULTISPECIES: beta-ketoacyl synthase chain length factor [Eikenella]OAM28386.1 hypothetical protein A7P95_05345 [Eikenella longinqua]
MLADFPLNRPLCRIQAGSRFLAEPQQTDGELRRLLREQYGIDARRLSRFTLLALLGALPLCQGLPENPAVYLASPFSSPGRLAAMRQKLAAGLPSPLDFMANIHNAATFHLAQILGSSGNSVFLAAEAEDCWAALYAALNEMLAEPGQTVLLGWAYERAAEGEPEGSVWWKLSGSLLPRAEGGRISVAGEGEAASALVPAAAGFLPAVLAWEDRARQGGAVLPRRGMWPALRVEWGER